MDGEVLKLMLPSKEELSKLVSTGEKLYKERLGMHFFENILILYYTYKVYFIVQHFPYNYSLCPILLTNLYVLCMKYTYA